MKTTNRLFLIALGSMTATASAQPTAPTGMRPIPIYETNRIDLSWRDASGDETSFEVERKDGAGAFVKIATTAANVTVFEDTTVDTTTEYMYRVRAVNAAGSSAYSNVAQQNLKVLWPVPASHEILHNWNDTIGSAGIGNPVFDPTVPGYMSNPTGFHRGVDIQRNGANVEVVPARGGEIQTAGGAGANAYYIIKVRVGDRVEFDEYNHLKMVTPGTAQIVYAGQTGLGQIYDGGFGGIHFVEHVHFDQTNSPFGDAVERHPLLLFSANADLDPGGAKPKLVDHGGSPAGSWLFRRQGGAVLPFDATHPLDGDVDIIVELADALGTDPDQVPVRLEWWIAPPADVACNRYSGVGTEARPLVLFDFSRRYFGKSLVDVAFSELMVDVAQNYGANIMVGGEAYPWPNYKHFVLTNTKGADGKPSSVDGAQHWNTNAKKPCNTQNCAGEADATKATDARFPDGIYTIHARASDLIQASDDLKIDVRIENFHPIVCTFSPRGDLPSNTASAPGFVLFNEAMDTTIAAAGLVSIDHGQVSDPKWETPTKLSYTLDGLKKGRRYAVTIKATAKDKAGTPGGRTLDGDKDGTGGDDFEYKFRVKKQ